jgi:hypothetical protein
VSAATDAALGFGEPVAEVVDLNFQSGPDPHLDGRLHLFNAALHYRHRVPVRSLVVLLRPAADHPRLTGQLTYGAGPGRVEFGYEVIRLWQQPVGPFLRGGLGLLPLAPLCELPAGASPESAVADVVREIDRRLRAETAPADAARLMTAAYLLTGARLERSIARQIFRGVAAMEESSTYQLILEEGGIRHSHRHLLRLGRQRFGPPDPSTEAALKAVTDMDRIDRMFDAVLTVSNWEELLNTI